LTRPGRTRGGPLPLPLPSLLRRPRRGLEPGIGISFPRGAWLRLRPRLKLRERARSGAFSIIRVAIVQRLITRARPPLALPPRPGRNYLAVGRFTCRPRRREDYVFHYGRYRGKKSGRFGSHRARVKTRVADNEAPSASRLPLQHAPLSPLVGFSKFLVPVRPSSQCRLSLKNSGNLGITFA